MADLCRRSICAASWAACAGALLIVLGAGTTTRAEVPATNPYTPYEFLIGEWDVGPEGGNAGLVARFRWGPNRSYLWYSASLLVNGAEEPHMEGVLMWNGVYRNLDMLMMVDLENGRIQERGVVSIEPDGTLVRDITAHYSEGMRLPVRGASLAGAAGATQHFKQTFKAAGPDRILTALTRESPAGWVPTFPGSDRLVMTRRASG